MTFAEDSGDRGDDRRRTWFAIDGDARQRHDVVEPAG
jgi:hypothetical protein